MNSKANTSATRTARIAGSIIASALITFTGLNLIANYALPGHPQSGSVKLAAATAATGAVPVR